MPRIITTHKHTYLCMSSTPTIEKQLYNLNSRHKDTTVHSTVPTTCVQYVRNLFTYHRRTVCPKPLHLPQTYSVSQTSSPTTYVQCVQNLFTYHIRTVCPKPLHLPHMYSVSKTSSPTTYVQCVPNLFTYHICTVCPKPLNLPHMYSVSQTSSPTTYVQCVPTVVITESWRYSPEWKSSVLLSHRPELRCHPRSRLAQWQTPPSWLKAGRVSEQTKQRRDNRHAITYVRK